MIAEDIAMQLPDPAIELQEQVARFAPDFRYYEGEGEFDGSIGIEPRYPHDDAYWHAYQRNLRQYWINQNLAS